MLKLSVKPLGSLAVGTKLYVAPATTLAAGVPPSTGGLTTGAAALAGAALTAMLNGVSVAVWLALLTEIVMLL
jgi:hypothetical protein